MATFLPFASTCAEAVNARSPLDQGRNEGSSHDANRRQGGSRVPCRGQEAPRCALRTVCAECASMSIGVVRHLNNCLEQGGNRRHHACSREGRQCDAMSTLTSCACIGCLTAAVVAVPAELEGDWKGDLAKQAVGRAVREGLEDAAKDAALALALDAASNAAASAVADRAADYATSRVRQIDDYVQVGAAVSDGVGAA